MTGTDESRDARSAAATRRIGLLLILLVFAVGVFVRFDCLGERSLWLDELSTWHVARLDLAESLRWGPERSIGPLYQLCVRVVARDSHPPEWLLRLPAAVAGSLAAVIAWWLGRRLGGSAVGTGLAMLVAFSQTQIHYSQEARPYSMLVLGSTLSVLLWHRLINRPARWGLVAYALVTTLTACAHFLIAFTLLGQVGWWVQRELRHPDRRRCGYACIALLATVILCGPLVGRTLTGWAEISTALAWIEPPTATQALTILADVTYGYTWLVVVLAAVLLPVAWPGRLPPPTRSTTKHTSDADGGSLGLLIWWLGASWAGLLLISRLVAPLMVARYALPAAVPALLLPLLVARRLHRHAPTVLAVLAVGLSLPGLYAARSAPALGFRELSSFLTERVEPGTATVVHAIAAVDPARVELECLAFRYYPPADIPVHDWLVNKPTVASEDSILADPRRLYVVAFLADPLPLIQAARRRIEPFAIDDQQYWQLAFGQYRLLKVAPGFPRAQSWP